MPGAGQGAGGSGNNHGVSRGVRPLRERGGEWEPPPEVNLTLSWWNAAVIRLPVAVPRRCQAALTMAVN